MPKTKHPKPAKLNSGWQEFRAAIRGFLVDWKLYVVIILIVSLPIDLLSLSASLSADTQFASFIQLAALFMNLALLWAIIRRTSGHKVTLGMAYYDGTAAILRFCLVSVTLVAMLIPAGLGVALYTLSLESVFAPGPFSVEQLLVGLVSLIIALPSFFLLVRFGMAIIAAVHDNLRPVAALRRSWRLTRRRFWVVTGRFALLFVFLILLSIPPTLITAAMVLLHAAGASIVVFELLATLLALPIANLYLVALYRNLVATMPVTPNPAKELTSE